MIDAQLLTWIRQTNWAVTTLEDCYGHMPGTGPPGWALFDMDEDDPPIAEFSFEFDAVMVCRALRALGGHDA